MPWRSRNQREPGERGEERSDRAARASWARRLINRTAVEFKDCHGVLSSNTLDHEKFISYRSKKFDPGAQQEDTNSVVVYFSSRPPMKSPDRSIRLSRTRRLLA